MIELFVILSASMLMDCPAEPVSEDERQHITSAAYEARSSARMSTDFESVTVRKCVVRYVTDDKPPIQGRSEYVSLYATFPHDIRTDRYRERYSIRCAVSTDFIENSETTKQEDCSESHERFLRNDRLPQEVSLSGNISAEDATAFLDYLIDYDLEPAAKKRLLKLMSAGGSVDAREQKGKLVFRMSFTLGGDASIDVSSEATRQPELRFHGIH